MLDSINNINSLSANTMNISTSNINIFNRISFYLNL